MECTLSLIHEHIAFLDNVLASSEMVVATIQDHITCYYRTCGTSCPMCWVNSTSISGVQASCETEAGVDQTHAYVPLMVPI